MSAAEIGGERFRRALVTPEGVALHLELASGGERATAFLLDALMIIAILVGLTIACLIVGNAVGRPAQMALRILWLLGFFVLRNGWFLGFELGPRAATPGKRILGLRVAARSGGRLSADALFARNAMREIEVFLPLSFLAANATQLDAWIAVFGVLWTGVFVFFPLFNRDRLRAGDLVAGTWVVRQPRRRLSADLAAANLAADPRFLFTPAQLDAYGVAELQVLEDVLRDPDRRALKLVAERIRVKTGWRQGAEETDRAFLEAYYAGLRQRLEAGLLMGRRRRDKHDAA